MEDGRKKIAVIARQQWGVVSREQAERAGISAASIRHLVTTGVWEKVLPNTFAFVGAPLTWYRTAWAALLWGGADSALSHRSAAFLLGWIDRAPSLIQLTVSQNEKAPITETFRIYRTRSLTSRETTTRKGLTVTNAPRTLIDLANEPDLEDILEGALYRSSNNLMWIKQRLFHGDGKGAPGVARLRAMIDARSPFDDKADSRAEARMKRMLRRAGFQFLHREPLIDPDGRLVCEGDFVFPRERTVVEFDGLKIHGRRRVQQTRATVQQLLAVMGWQLVPYTADDLRHRPAYVVDQLKTILAVRNFASLPATNFP